MSDPKSNDCDDAGENLANMIPEETIHRVAHYLSLGLDCNVMITDYRESVALLFSEILKDSWILSPPKLSRDNQVQLANVECKRSTPLVPEEAHVQYREP